MHEASKWTILSCTRTHPLGGQARLAPVLRRRAGGRRLRRARRQAVRRQLRAGMLRLDSTLCKLARTCMELRKLVWLLVCLCGVADEQELGVLGGLLLQEHARPERGACAGQAGGGAEPADGARGVGGTVPV